MTNLLKNVSIFFGNRINICIIVLMLFIILFYIIQKDDKILIEYNNIHNNNYINNKKNIPNKLVNVNISEGNYIIKNNNGIILSPNFVDKFGTNIKQQNNEYFNNNFWKIKKNNQYYIFDKSDSKSCLSVQNDILKELDYEDCNKKSLCGIEDIINQNDNNDKIKTSYFNIYNTENGNIISFNNKYLVFNNNNIKLTKNILDASPIIFEKI